MSIEATDHQRLLKSISLKPQARRVLRHFRSRRTISPMEAIVSYGIFRLAASIHELRKAGYSITTDLRQDAGGHRYARYRMAS